MKNWFMVALVLLIVCCIFFGCCRVEGLANPPKYELPSDPTELQCLNAGHVWDGETCSPNPLDQEENVPTPEGFQNYF